MKKGKRVGRTPRRRQYMDNGAIVHIDYDLFGRAIIAT